MKTDRIIRWRPFLYCYEDYEGKKYKVTFTCPKCGGHNCEAEDDLDKDDYWSGYFRCADCGETHDNGKPICYYSDCFTHIEERQTIQLTLF